MWRSITSLAIVTVAAMALYFSVFLPYFCNLREAELERRTVKAWKDRHSHSAWRAAASNLELVERCIDRCDGDVGFLMLSASNLTMLRRQAAALRVLDDALRLDQRPELYMARGLAQLETGARQEALESFVFAAEFAGPAVLADVEDAALRREAYRIATTRLYESQERAGRVEKRNLLTNSEFSAASASPQTRTKTRGHTSSAAPGWQVTNGGGQVETSIVASNGDSLGNALWVSTSGPSSGIRQLWPPSTWSARARTTARILVRRGRVCLGSGSGRPPMLTVCTSPSTKWQQLSTINDSCPASVTVIHAVSPDGAEFVVDSVSAYASPGYPCER